MRRKVKRMWRWSNSSSKMRRSRRLLKVGNRRMDVLLGGLSFLSLYVLEGSEIDGPFTDWCLGGGRRECGVGFEEGLVQKSGGGWRVDQTCDGCDAGVCVELTLARYPEMKPALELSRCTRNDCAAGVLENH